MKIEKLPSGSYRVRKTVNGKTFCTIFDHKPTEAEIVLVLSDKIGSDDLLNYGVTFTFKIAADKYIKTKENVLSPASVREYNRIPTRLSEEFIKKPIDKITNVDIQAEINELAKTKTFKTVKDYYSFIVAVIKYFKPRAYFDVKLPQKVIKEEPYIPTNEEVLKLIEDSKTDSNGMYFVPIKLATYGMRRSEILALNPSDIIKDGYLYISKAKVQNNAKEWVVKGTKTPKSTRKIPLPQEVIDKIQEQGYVYKGGAQSISNYIARWCDKNNVKHFSLHKLRHYFATRLLSNGADGETVNYLGGWSSDYVVNRHYKHKSEEKVKSASEQLEQILF